MNKYNDMCVQFYNYRVEFQMRGAGHIHGVLWIDWKKMREKMNLKSRSKETAILNVDLIVRAFENIKNEVFGSVENDAEETALAALIDHFCTCSLKNPTTYDIVNSVQIHNCTKPCYKYGPECRFGAPWFPSLRTIVSVPRNIRYNDPEEATNELKKSKNLLKQVKEILENEQVMKYLSQDYEREISIYMKYQYMVLFGQDILEELNSGACIFWKDVDQEIHREYNSQFEMTSNSYEVVTKEQIAKLIDICIAYVKI